MCEFMNTKNALYVVSFADLVADVLIEIPKLPVEPAAHQVVKKVGLEPGGAGNFLIAGQRLGLCMSTLAVVGSDAFGLKIVKILEQENIDVEGINIQGEDGTTVVFVLADANKQHVFLGKYGTGPKVAFNQVWRQKIMQANAVQFWGYSLLEERIIPAVLDAVSYAHQQGKLVSFDPGPLLGEAQPDHRKTMLNNSDIVLLTENEIPLLINGSPDLSTAQKLLSHGPSVICVKRGAQGCVVFTRDEKIEHPGYPVEVRDTTAAGDSFNAAFLYGYLNRWPLVQVVSFANAMGAAKVQKYGSGRKVPTMEEVRMVLTEHGESPPDIY